MFTVSTIKSEDTSPKSAENTQDPEGFLRRCSGYNKGSFTRCKQPFSRRQTQIFEKSALKYLPTCSNHTDQQVFAGRCKHMLPDGVPCGRLFRWTPPYLELCSDHASCPDINMPCYFLRLPTELRLMVFRYLLPDEPIGNSPPPLPFRGVRSNSYMPMLNLFLVNREIYRDVKGLVFSTAPFAIDIRNGLYMCGLQLLQPTNPDGSPHLQVADKHGESHKFRFINRFDFQAVKNYKLDILVENMPPHILRLHGPGWWDEEVELYDVRDYVAVAVSGILGKAEHLSRLEIRICFCDFDWTQDKLLTNARCVLGPLQRLRNVLKPTLHGIYALSGFSTPSSRFVAQQHLLSLHDCAFSKSRMLVGPGNKAFDEYKAMLETALAQKANTSVIEKSRIHAMFIGLKDFYAQFLKMAPSEVGLPRQGKESFIHRARVAREMEDLETFRLLQNELVQAWLDYLERWARQKQSLSQSLARMLAMDTYPMPDSRGTVNAAPSPSVPTPDSRNKRSSNGQSQGTAPFIPMQSHQVIQRIRAVIASRNSQRLAQGGYLRAGDNPADPIDADKVAAFNRLMDSASKHLQAYGSSGIENHQASSSTQDVPAMQPALSKRGGHNGIREAAHDFTSPGPAGVSGGALPSSGVPVPLLAAPNATVMYQDASMEEALQEHQLSAPRVESLSRASF
ncbi:uncharacterized protein EI97DRAFT_103138 [Westerdykella ornata]|uniref:F-box domain-containing protein n=1 Tax=Westerdykella ornata TaxID=318751 RepID=A0A6A6JD92_WESOR|nr:uncharacterized protein EI97DRAFT_103138 [Westerdykella ornata]KAF2274590.1 hypothetical protein EI97DRAFT_103138 [Westerdykella ornata]